MDKLKRNSTPDLDKAMAAVGFELLNSVTKAHVAHLGITGPGSFAIHKALNQYYDKIGDLADEIIESYQGCTERLLEFPVNVDILTSHSAADCVSYLRELCYKVDQLQKIMPYSDIVNKLDEVKSLINSTKYKLIFLS